MIEEGRRCDSVVAIEQSGAQETRADEEEGAVSLGIEPYQGHDSDEQGQRRGQHLHEGMKLGVALPGRGP